MTLEEAIKKYLDEKAANDPLFAQTYAKKNKSLKECCAYIMQEARKQAKSRCAAIWHEEVYNWAVHYYDEDSIKVTSAPKGKVTAPNPTKPAKTAPAGPKPAKKAEECTKKELKRGDDCFSLFAFE